MKTKLTKKDIVHITIILFICIAMIIQLLCRKEFGVVDILSNILIPVFTYVGLLDFFFALGLKIMLPDFFLESKVAISASMYTEKISSLLKFSIDEFNFLLSLKDVERDRYVRIKSTKEKLRQSIKEEIGIYLKSPLITVSSGKLISTSIPDIDYYINFYDIVYNYRFQEKLASIMSDFIELEIEPKELDKITHIVIPYDSNLLFGTGVAKKLNKKALKIINIIPPYHLKKYWEGEIEENDFENIIIIHDVLYTGQQVIESCQKLAEGLNKKLDDYKFHFFAICARKSGDIEKNGLQNLKQKGFNVHTIIEFNDSDIRKVIYE
jgi:orotate phosphoribosyltransferase-like protein